MICDRVFKKDILVRITASGILLLQLSRAKPVITLKVIAYNLRHLARVQQRGIAPA
ncbi:hypothetical protein HDE80_001502 [Rhodanobacter sp. A1T4]|nr:hypothetical protein [Rhodanobacter sp. A1T4]